MASNGSGPWQELPGNATDIGAGADGHVWAAGTLGVPHYWEDFPPSSPVPGDWPVAPPNNLQGVTRIAVGPTGLAWAIVENSEIVRRTGSQFPGDAWQNLPGGATDIGVGADGHVWVAGGLGVPHYWEDFPPSSPVPGDWPVAPPNNLDGVIRIAVGPDGLPWAVLQDFQIMRRTGDQFPGAKWEQFPGQAIDIGVSPEGIVWIVGPDGIPKGWDWDSSVWVPQPGVSLASISVGPQGQAWGVTTTGVTYRWIRPVD